jgi:quinol monooxygenase YgiN
MAEEADHAAADFFGDLSFSAKLVREYCISMLLRALFGVDHERGSTMAKVSMTGTITCQDGKRDEMEQVLRAMVDAARLEPGVEIYSYHRGDGNTFSFFALMANEEAMHSHGQTEAMRAAMAAFGPLMAGPPQMSVLTPIAAVGFDV